ncbi:MAG: hypothetical protein Q8941_24315, partial [Bacteroidota bacterium]|nr:hypothetical protein [Bacteroidota bacterium]
DKGVLNFGSVATEGLRVNESHREAILREIFLLFPAKRAKLMQRPKESLMLCVLCSLAFSA